jgi:poly-beta-1,6-N-acetyl-D-glucosamine synthase
MVILLFITSAVVLLYFLYPVYLMVCPKYKVPSPKNAVTEQAFTLILLTYNGIACIQEKISRLAEEIKHFHAYEFIVVDDCSTDGTRELLESLSAIYPINLVLKTEHSGIPHSMNLGVQMARYDFIVFCDQRQQFTGNILREILYPLHNDDIGAVSGIISCRGNGNHLSFLRKHENFIKKCESRTGYLVGVYGPLYAIKKSCFSRINDNIILDDLFLSLKILDEKKIVLIEACKIVDDDFINLYDFNRSKRYFQGLLQILVKKDLVGNLPFRIKIMLLWHKYLRLLIPPLLVLCYLTAAFFSSGNYGAAMLFTSISIIFLLSILANRMVIFTNLNAFFRINVYYFISMISLTIQRFYSKSISQTRARKV